MPDNVQLQRQVNMLLQEKNYGAAARQVEVILASGAGNETVLIMGVIANLERKAPAAARVLLEQLEGIAKDTMFIGYLWGKYYVAQGQYAAAVDILRRVIADARFDGTKAPLQVEVYKLYAECYGGTDEAKVLYYLRRAFAAASDQAAKKRIHEGILFAMHYPQGFSQQELFSEHQGFAAYFARIKPYTAWRHNGEKIRIGYISPDFHSHVVVFFSYRLLSDYNRDRFHVTCYAKGEGDDATASLRRMVDCWRTVDGLSDAETARLIHADQIDILFDLAGHTEGNSLAALAHKPAPIQISGIGYFDTTGLAAVDYFLTDVHCDPPGKNDAYFCEKLLRLPNSHFCYVPPSVMPADCGAAPCVKRAAITFGSFNYIGKTTDEMLRLWKEILKRVPGSRLILKSRYLENADKVKWIKKRLFQAGLRLSDVELRGFSQAHWREYQEIDIALDTYPYPGGGTTCDALFMGVPVITLAGERHGARFGYSLLKNIGLEEGIAFTPEEYIEKAVALAGKPERIAQLRHSLREQMRRSPLMDGKSYMRDVEAAYEAIWEEYAANKESSLSLGDANHGERGGPQGEKQREKGVKY